MSPTFAARLFLFALLNLPAMCLDRGLTISQLVHTAWARDQRFPVPNIQTLTHAADGYLWMGTDKGVFRFDGVRATPWLPAGNDPLPGQEIRAFANGSNGSLWVATTGGVARVKDGKVIEKLVSSNEGRVELVVQAYGGKLWAIANGPASAIRVFDDARLARNISPAELQGATVLSLYTDTRHGMWVGTNRGLFRMLANGSFECAMADAAVMAISEDDRGDILFADRSTRSVLRLQGSRAVPVVTDSGGITARVMTRDRDGNVWVGTLGQGLIRINGDRTERFTRRDGLSSDLVQSIFEDRQGNLWVATVNGLDRFRNTRAPRLTSREGLSGDVVTAVWSNGNSEDVWVGTLGGGLSRVHGGNVTSVSALQRSTILSLFEDRREDRGLWAGTTSGLFRLSRGKWTEVTGPRGASLTRVSEISRGRDGVLWLLDGVTGLLTIPAGQDKPVAAQLPLPASKRIYQIHASAKGALWIGFLQGGVAAVQDGTVHLYDTNDGLASGAVYSIHEDDSGSVWVGSGAGLSRFRNGRWTRWTREEGVPAGGVHAITSYESGDLWLMTAEALLSVDSSRLAGTPDAAHAKLSARPFRIDDGVRMPSERGIANPRITRARDGTLWMASEDGVVMIDPRRMKAQTEQYPVAIESIAVDGAIVSRDSKGPVAIQGRELQIVYTALNLSTPDRVVFRYKLDRFDHEWRDADTRRTAVYTNLPPGDYQFAVSAGEDGVWYSHPAGLAIRMQPYFYQTNWFLALCVAGVLLIVWGVHLLRQHHLQTRFALAMEDRARVAREVHDTVLQGFAGAVYQMHAALSRFYSDPEVSRHNLVQALGQADESLREAREVLSFMRLSSMGDDSLVDALTKNARKLISGTPVQFKSSATGEPLQLTFNQQSNLYILAREAIYNAVNHGHATLITLDIEYSPAGIRIDIHDNGCGFDVDTLKDNDQHFGLTGMRERAKAMSAILTIDSKPGEGTRIKIVLPRKRPQDARKATIA